MQSEKRLMETVELENGLILHFYDLSKPITGGRYQVQLLVSMTVEIKQEYFNDFEDPLSAFNSFRKAKGKEIEFRQEKFRNFIADVEMKVVLEKMKQEYLEANRMYLGHAAFPKKYVMKVYREWQDEEAIRCAQEQAMQSKRN